MADKKISALTASTTPLAGTEVLPIVQSGSTVKVSVANLTAGRDVSALTVSASSGNPFFGGGQTLIQSNTGYYQGTALIDNLNATGAAQVNSGIASWKLQLGGGNGSDFGYDSFGISRAPAGGIAFAPVLKGDSSGNISAVTGNLVIGTAGKGIDFSANTHAAGMTSELLKWYEEGAWTPVISSAAGAITSYSVNSASYTRIGRRVVVDFDITITNNGTGAAGINITGVPFTVATAYASCGSFREVAATGFGGFIIASSSTTIQAANYDNAYAGGTNYRLVGTFSYNA